MGGILRFKQVVKGKTAQEAFICYVASPMAAPTQICCAFRDSDLPVLFGSGASSPEGLGASSRKGEGRRNLADTAGLLSVFNEHCVRRSLP